jgi:hypothetical protein
MDVLITSVIRRGTVKAKCSPRSYAKRYLISTPSFMVPRVPRDGTHLKLKISCPEKLLEQCLQLFFVDIALWKDLLLHRFRGG